MPGRYIVPNHQERLQRDTHHIVKAYHTRARRRRKPTRTFGLLPLKFVLIDNVPPRPRLYETPKRARNTSIPDKFHQKEFSAWSKST